MDSYSVGQVAEDQIVRADVALDEDQIVLAEKLLAKQRRYQMPLFWKNKYEREAPKFWNQFYERNEQRFFRDRHYLEKTFPILCEARTILECGCGVGNALFPLLESSTHLKKVIALDLSARAIDILKERAHESGLLQRVSARVCDISSMPLLLGCDGISEAHVDVAILLFSLSAVPPSLHINVLLQVAQSIRPGGHLVFRDYGRFDLAQLRFQANARIDEWQYVRQDGTLSYFFGMEELRTLFENVGLTIKDMHYIKRKVYNRKNGDTMLRVWINALCMKLE